MIQVVLGYPVQNFSKVYQSESCAPIRQKLLSVSRTNLIRHLMRERQANSIMLFC